MTMTDTTGDQPPPPPPVAAPASSASMASGEPDEILEPLADPPKSSGTGTLDNIKDGALGIFNRTKAVVVETSQKIAAHPHAQKAGEITKKGYEVTKKGVVAGATKVGEVSKKGWDKANENEKVRNAVEKVQDVGGKTWDKTKDVTGKAWDKTKEHSSNVYDKSKEGLQKAHGKITEVSGQVGEKVRPALEKTKVALGVTHAKGKEVWAAGGGAIVRIKEQIDDIRWGGDAKTVLLMREESAKKWMDIRIRGAEEIQVAARKEYTTNYFVEKGTMVKWSFRVKDYDIGFGVRIRVMQDGGSVEEDILGVEKFDATDTIEGSWTADEDRTIVLVFDNSKSLLRAKTVCYLVGVIPPPKEPLEHVDNFTADPAAQPSAPPMDHVDDFTNGNFQSAESAPTSQEIPNMVQDNNNDMLGLDKGMENMQVDEGKAEI